MRSALAAGVIALAAPLVIAPPAQAVDGWSVDIITTKATAWGSTYRLGTGGKKAWYRPIFQAQATVTCPAGEPATIWVNRVWAMMSPATPVTCTGAPQTVTVNVAGEKGDMTVTTDLKVGTSVMATDTESVHVKLREGSGP